MRQKAVVKFMSLLVVLATVITACGSNDSSSSKLDDSLGATDVLENASQRLSGTETMRFAMEIKGKTIIDPAGTMQLLSAKGTMERPNKVDVEFRLRVLGAQTVSIRMITIGDESWTTDIVTGKWVTAPDEFGYNPSVLYDNQEGLGPVMGKLQDAEIAGTEDVDGRAAYHVTGNASQGVMRPLTSGTMKGDPIGVDLWIDGETWDILRVVVREPDDSGNDEPATWTMDLTDHDQEVTIEAPV